MVRRYACLGRRSSRPRAATASCVGYFEEKYGPSISPFGTTVLSPKGGAGGDFVDGGLGIRPFGKEVDAIVNGGWADASSDSTAVPSSGRRRLCWGWCGADKGSDAGAGIVTCISVMGDYFNLRINITTTCSRFSSLAPLIPLLRRLDLPSRTRA